MDRKQADLVRESWHLLRPNAAQAAEIFYRTLFEMDPSLRSLFKGDMTRQGEQLMKMIGVAVARLDDPAGLVPTLRALAERHVGYGVTEDHYATVGRALMNTLQQGLGEAFTPEVSSAWLEVYLFIAETMIERTRELTDASDLSFAEAD